MRLRRILILVCSALAFCLSLRAQSANVGNGDSPHDVIERFWKLATEGNFLNVEGWNKYSGFFRDPKPYEESRIIRVVSNDWGLLSVSVKETHADVVVEYADAGTIDSALRYTPPRPSQFIKTARVYHLLLAPTKSRMLFSDGKRVTGSQERLGPPSWQISDAQYPSFATVNTAIRYVLEQRAHTKDPHKKKNADITISKLLQIP